MKEHGVDLKTVQKRYEGKAFDEFMKNYLSIFDPNFLSECSSIHNQAASTVSSKGGGNVVELAVGSGRNLASGCYNHPNLEVLGLDISDGMLDEAKRKVSAFGLENAKLERGDVRDALSKVGSNFADLTVMTYGLCVTPEPEVVMQEMLDITKPGGLVLIMEYVFAQNQKIREEQKEIAPIGKTEGIRFYESRKSAPNNGKETIDYENIVVALGPDGNGHAIVWDPTFDLRSAIPEVFGDKVEKLRELESEKDKLQTNMFFLGRKR